MGNVDITKYELPIYYRVQPYFIPHTNNTIDYILLKSILL